MSGITKRLKNTTGTDAIYQGQTISAGTYFTIPFTETERWEADATVVSALLSGNLLANDGTNDYANANQGLAFFLGFENLESSVPTAAAGSILVYSGTYWYAATGLSATGVQGVTGVQGSTGVAGATGVQGIQGSTGIQGNTGVAGATGRDGPTGFQGQTGVQGTTGVQGLVGVQGATGVIGVAGSTGVQGIQGATGLQGQTGVAGATGRDGPTGFQGLTGVAGTTGVQGTAGVEGNTGVAGATGRDGPTGFQGVTGFQGLTGIQGQTGIQGNTGVQGATGFQGVTGVQGITGIIGQFGGFSGEWEFSTATSGTPAAGQFYVNNATWTNVTSISISTTDFFGQNQLFYLGALVNSNNPNKSQLSLYQSGMVNNTGLRVYLTSGVSNGSYWTYSCSVIGVGTQFSNGAISIIDGSTIGDQGTTGPQGVTGINGALNPVVVVTANTTLTTSNCFVVANSSGAITLTLPAISSVLQTIGGTNYTLQFFISNMNTGTVTVAAAGSDTIVGAATTTLKFQYSSITLLASSVGWSIT